MFCNKCGKQISNDSKYCPECGVNINGQNDRGDEGSFGDNICFVLFKQA
ncbi:zinc-ribbon domain-containing protein [Thomasclavelia saccharogumia]|nr:zinc-ribbon domain-containing protein [Thomasclavelia saccharogumia]